MVGQISHRSLEVAWYVLRVPCLGEFRPQSVAELRYRKVRYRALARDYTPIVFSSHGHDTERWAELMCEVDARSGPRKCEPLPEKEGEGSSISAPLSRPSSLDIRDE